MPNIKISDLPPIALPIDLNTSFLEVQTVEGGEDVSRKATVDQIAQAGGAPADATYVTLSLNPTLSNERTLDGEAGVVSITDNGAGLTVEIGIDALGIDTAKLAADAVDNTKLADMAQDTIKGRQTGSGTGDPEDLTAAQVVAIISSSLPPSGYFILSATDRVVGSNAGTSQTGDSVFLANALAGDVNIADNVIAIGSSALAVAAQLDFDGTIAIGQNAGALLTDTRDPWVIIGKDAAANMPGAAFHDGNTVIGTEALLNNTSTNMQGVTVLGHRAGFRISGAVAVTGSTIIGFEAAGDGTPQVASVTNSVIIGFRALSNYGPTQVGNLVVIGRNAGQDISGDDDSVIIGADAFLQGSGGDDSVFIGSSCYGSATGSMKSVYIGQAAGGATALGDFNVVIGSQSLTTPGATGLDHSVMLGFSVGNDIGSETALFLVESTQGTTSFVNRPYLYGSTLNGNLALLSVNDTSTQDENGTRNIPSWGSANGVWTMSGAGTDLGATGDADFMHSWIRNADTALMLQFPTDDTISLLHNGTDSIIANSAGAMRLNGIGDVILSSNSVEGFRLAEDNGGILQVPSATLAITAFAGGGQVSAVPLTQSYNVVTTVATFNDSVRLPDVFAVNSLVEVKNEGAAQLAIFPASGDDAGEGVDTLVPLQTGNSITFIATVANSTWTLLDTGGIATALLGLNNNGPQIADILATLTVPNLIPNKPDVDTGTGWGGNDILVHIAGGVQAQQFRELVGGVFFAPATSLTVTAFAGGGQGSATALINSYNIITTVATAGDSVRLPDIFSVNAVVYIKNDGAETADVFPASGDDLGAGVDTAVSLAAGQSISFIATVSSSTWTPFIVDTVSGGVATSLLATNPAGPAIVDEAATSLNPTIIVNQAELDTGFGWTSADRISAVGGGVLIAEFLNTAGVHQIIVPQDNQAGSPAIAFGDGDTGFHEFFDDRLALTLGGSNFILFDNSILTMQITGTIRSTNSAGFALLNETASATNPTLNPSFSDADTGLGLSAADQLALIAGGVRVANLTEAAGVVQLIVPQQDNAASPSIAFGDGNTGFYENADNFLSVAIAGVREFAWGAGTFQGITSGAGAIFNEATTATNPTLIPFNTDADTGIGSAGSNILSLIAGGIEGVRYTGANSQVLATPDRQTVVAEDTLFTQAAATEIFSSLAIIDSPEEAAGTKLPLVFPVDTIIEFNYGDPSASEEGTTLYPGVGDDLGAGVNTAVILPIGSWKFRATVADSTWEEMSQGATALKGRDATAPAIVDLPADGDPHILIRRDFMAGWGSEAAAELNLKMTGFNAERYVRTASGVLISRGNQTITANAGGGQGSATEILSTMCRVSTVATTGDSVRLPTTFLVNTEIEVFNAGANAMDVFPASGDDLGAGVDTAVSVAVGALTRFKSMDATVWVQCWTG